MIAVLGDDEKDLLPGFTGAAGQSRCFLHISNLSAKSLLRVFDPPKKKAPKKSKKGKENDTEEVDDEDEDDAELAALADIDVGEEMIEPQTGADDELKDDDMDGWVDDVDLLSDDERKELDVHVRPVKFMITKVRKCWN